MSAGLIGVRQTVRRGAILLRNPTPGKAMPESMFDDRLDAARQLAVALAHLRGRQPLFLAIPRGAVPMAALLADRLEGEWDVVLVRKIPAPGNPELAIGAVDESGQRTVTGDAAWLGVDDAYLDAESDRQLALIRQRRRLYTPDRGPVPVAGRTVVIVDDGLATGATMSAALAAVRAGGPAHLVCAVPVAALDSLARTRKCADETVCLLAPAWFQAVGQFYRDFPQVDDEEVIALLRARDAAGGL